jgi:serine-type D-Ala-D-Ala carboxypeptidase (penicillin-binding protein 5/6)
VKHKRSIWLLLPFIILLTCLTSINPYFSIHVAFAATDASVPADKPDLTAQSAILIDLDSGQVLYQKDPDARHYPASITKILTAILALEHSKLTDLVRTSKLATEQEGNRIYLVEGEQEPMEDMLYGLLLNSGNDAAVAIAEHVAGSIPAFADMMNAKAKEIGATNSHFVTPNGLHDPNHYTTAHDMALIARYAMQIPEFRKIVSTQYRDWHGKAWDSTLVNLNRLLWTYQGATGIKTGFTDQAQQTTVVSAKRGNMQLLAVLLDIQGLDKARQEAAELLDYGYQHFQKVKLANKGQVITTIPLMNQQLHAYVDQDVWYDQPSGMSVRPQAKTVLNVPNAPFAANTKVGTVSYSIGDNSIQVPLLSKERVTIPTQTHTSSLIWRIILICFAALLVVRYLNRIRIRRKKQRTKQSTPSYYPYK